MGIEYNEMVLSIMLLDKLPENYEAFIGNILNGRDAVLAPHLLKSKIVEEYDAKRRKQEITNEAFLMNQPKKHQDNKDGSWIKDIVCFNCQKKGHFQRDCRSKRVYRKPIAATVEETVKRVEEESNIY